MGFTIFRVRTVKNFIFPKRLLLPAIIDFRSTKVQLRQSKRRTPPNYFDLKFSINLWTRPRQLPVHQKPSAEPQQLRSDVLNPYSPCQAIGCPSCRPSKRELAMSRQICLFKNKHLAFSFFVFGGRERSTFAGELDKSIWRCEFRTGSKDQLADAICISSPFPLESAVRCPPDLPFHSCPAPLTTRLVSNERQRQMTQSQR